MSVNRPYCEAMGGLLGPLPPVFTEAARTSTATYWLHPTSTVPMTGRAVGCSRYEGAGGIFGSWTILSLSGE